MIMLILYIIIMYIIMLNRILKYIYVNNSIYYNIELCCMMYICI